MTGKHLEVSPRTMLIDLWHDLLVALRAHLRNRSLSGGIIVTFAVAVGTMATTLSVANPILLRQLPFPDPDRLHRVIATDRSGESMWLSWATLADLQERVRRQQPAGYTAADFTVSDAGPEPILAAIVTEGFFDVLGVLPQRGRTFLAPEYTTAGERTVILSHAFWQRRYGGDPPTLSAAASR